MNNNPKQIEAKILGDKGCYFLSIINSLTRYCEKNNENINIDIIGLYEKCTEEEWLGKDCFVERPDLIAGYILGVPLEELREAFLKNRKINEVQVEKRPLDYIPAENELEITRYEKDSTGVTFSHFVETRDGIILYDPYGKSNTVSNGKPVSKRIFTINIKL